MPNHWKGFGIHSPFVFDLVNNLFRIKHQYHGLSKINSLRKALENNHQVLTVTDMGAGSVYGTSSSRTISEIARRGAITKKHGRLLFQLACRFKPFNILELGTSLGISTLYLALPDSGSKVISIEGCPLLTQQAAFNFEQLQVKNVQQLTGSFNDKLPLALEELGKVDMVFFDGDHREDATIDYFYRCLPSAHNDSIFIFDDIHWSKGMNRAWKKILEDPAVTVSLDLFRIGIVFFRKESQKEHFVIRY